MCSWKGFVSLSTDPFHGFLPPSLEVDFFGPDAPVKEDEDGILIVRYHDGRASGDAFAVFDTDKELEKAMTKDRSSLGTRYIELYRSSVKEFKAVS